MYIVIGEQDKLRAMSAVTLKLPADERRIPTLHVAVFLRQIPSWDLL